MQQLWADKYPCNAQVIRRYLNKHCPKTTEPVMVRPNVPGQDRAIDFGYLGNCIDQEGKTKKAWVFSFRLRHSRWAYLKVVLDRTSNIFLRTAINHLTFQKM